MQKNIQKLINFIRETYPEIYPGTFLIDNTARIVMIKDEEVVFTTKYVYNSSKGEYIRVNKSPNVYVRVYL